jgi:mxaJ protein
MYLPCHKLVLLALAALPLSAQSRLLRVCADPNNLPFSNQEQQGFENRLADLLAGQMNARLEYTWWTERKSFVKHSLNQDACDVLLGVPSSLPDVLTTEPYYRSTYVFVTRRDRRLQISSLTDDRLSHLRIGIHMVGDDYAPPAFALAHRGITQNIVPFSLFGSPGEPNPPSKLIDAVASGVVDIAIVWGPFAGYFAQRASAPLAITPVAPPQFSGVPFAYAISAAVRSGNEALKSELDQILASQSVSIRKILDSYGVPQAP